MKLLQIFSICGCALCASRDFELAPRSLGRPSRVFQGLQTEFLKFNRERFRRGCQRSADVRFRASGYVRQRASLRSGNKAGSLAAWRRRSSILPLSVRGVAESARKQIVRSQFKQSGFRWLKVDAEALLAAKCCVKSSRWANVLDWSACDAEVV